jgi:hypothetical protein
MRPPLTSRPRAAAAGPAQFLALGRPVAAQRPAQPALSQLRAYRPVAARRADLLQATAAAPPASSTPPSPSPSTSSSDADYLALTNVTVRRTSDGVAVPLLSTFRAGPADRTLLFILTHAADLAPFELVPRVLKALPALTAAGVQVSFIVLGSPANATAFAARLGVPPALLFADETGATHAALGFSRGFDPAVPKLNPYVRLGAMLAGIGSPGTIGRVIKGYVGDRQGEPIFGPGSPFDILGSGYTRPMERATQRLMSMAAVLSGWGELAPADAELLTRLGGCLALKGRGTVLKHVDAGILDYVDLKAACGAVGAVKALPE